MMIYDDLWMGISNYKAVCVGLVIQMGCEFHIPRRVDPSVRFFLDVNLQGTRLGTTFIQEGTTFF